MFQQYGLKGNWNQSKLLLSYMAEIQRDPRSHIVENEVFTILSTNT